MGQVFSRLGATLKFWFVLFLVLPSLFWASASRAHEVGQSYLYFDVKPTSLAGRVELRIDDINAVLQLDIPSEREAAVAALTQEFTTITAYASQHLTLSYEDNTWPYTFTHFEYLETANGNFAQLFFNVEGTFATLPLRWTVHFDVFFAEQPDNRAFVLIGHYWEGGILENEGNILQLFKPGDAIHEIELETPSWWKGITTTVVLGVEHILIGHDHILFILVLLLPSVLVWRAPAGFQPSPSFRESLWQLLKIVTMFTIAHSITLTLGGFGKLSLNSKLVESIIAASIIAAALHNIRPVFANKEWIIAFAFGLFHGMGFAGLLDELGLNRSNRVYSLLGFNVGVEIGQAFIVLLVFPLLFWLRAKPVYRHILLYGSLAMALVACVWLLERILEIEIF